MEKLELFTYLRQVLSNCSGYEFIDRFLDELSREIDKRKHFSCEQFKDWVDYKSVAKKTTPFAFLHSCGLADIRAGKFDDTSFKGSAKTYCFVGLLNDLRLNDITVDNDDTYYITYVESYILENNLMDFDELVAWNRQAINFLKGKGKTSKDFIYLFKNTKAMRALSLPSDIDERVAELNRKWNDLIERVESVPIVESET